MDQVFLVQKENRLFLITNKHMIGDYNPAGITRLKNAITIFMYSESSSIPIRIPISVNNQNPMPNVKLHPDPTVDVAAVDITAFTNDHPEVVLYRFGISMLTPLDSIETQGLTGVGDLVFAIGYPARFKDFLTNQPLLKAGYISSLLNGKLVLPTSMNLSDGTKVDFTLKGKIFLVDGLITFGNSGGPIIAHKGMRLRIKNQKIEYSQTPQNKVLGIVSLGWAPVGLTVVFSSDYIIEVLDLFFYK